MVLTGQSKDLGNLDVLVEARVRVSDLSMRV